MSSLRWERSSFVQDAQDLLARVPANTPLVTGLLAGAAAISILAVAMSAPATESAASAAPPAVVAASAPVVHASTRPTCKEQTWPYVDRSCAQQDAGRAGRPVRVISTDRGAPSTLHAGPVVLAAQAERVQPVSVVASGAVPEPAPLRDIVASSEPQEVVPMPRRRPVQVVASQRLPSATRLSKVLTLPPPPIRAEDDEDASQVQAYALSGGRRVTVYRQYGNPAERAVISRNDVYERPSLRLPFFNLFD